MKLRGKFIVLVTALFGSVVFILFLFTLGDQRGARDTIIEAERDELGHFAYQIKSRFDAYILDLAIMAQNPAISGISVVALSGGVDTVSGFSLVELKAQFKDIFERRTDLVSYYDKLQYIDKNGRGVVGVRRGARGVEYFSESELLATAEIPYIKEALSGEGDVYISDVELSEKFGVVEVPRRPVVHVVKKIKDTQGNLAGLLALSVSAGDFLDFFKELAVEDSEILFLIDQDGYFLMDTEFPSREFGRQSIAGSSFSSFYEIEGNLFDFVANKENIVTDESGTPHVFSVVHYNDTRPEQFMVLFEKVRISEALAPVNQRFFQNLTIFSLIFLGIFVIAYVYFIAPIIGRILKNISLMRLIQKGDFPEYRPIQGKDEVSDMTAGLFEMSRRLGESDRELREAEEHLEVKLKELASRNEILEDTKRAMVNILEDSRKLENTIKEERDRFEAIVSTMSEGLLVIDTQYRVILTNATAERTLGYKAQEMAGKDMTDFIRAVKDQKPFNLKDLPFAQMFTDGKPVHVSMMEDMSWSSEYAKSFPVEITMAPLLKTGFIAAVIIFRNVKDWKELDMARSNFISTASHQLRTPLGIIRWYAEMLAEGDLDDAQKDFVDRIYRGALRSIEVINLLLLIARMESGRLQITPERIAVAPFVNNMMKDFEGEFGQKKIKTSITIAPRVPDLFVDPTMAHEVLANLISNGIRYTNDAGNLSVDVSMDSSGFAQFAVKDDGIGIPEDSRKKIFQRFYRAPNAEVKIAGGSGLGLALAQTLVEKWRGKIWFVSEEGKGTVFYFTAPVVKSDDNIK